MKLILGSSSKPRREVLEQAGYQFEIMSPDIDEKAIRTADHYQLPLLLASAKADALLSRAPADALIITADQVVVCDGNLHEKPRDAEEARMFLKRYSQSRAAETVSAVMVTNMANGQRSGDVDIARTYFRAIPNEVIAEYITTRDPFIRAGGYDVQSSILLPYLDRIEGAEDSIMGMPLGLLERLIKEVS